MSDVNTIYRAVKGAIRPHLYDSRVYPQGDRKVTACGLAVQPAEPDAPYAGDPTDDDAICPACARAIEAAEQGRRPRV